MHLPLPYCGTLSVSLTAASSPKGRAKRGVAVSARQITICLTDCEADKIIDKGGNLMQEYAIPSSLPAVLLPWYEENRRALP